MAVIFKPYTLYIYTDGSSIPKPTRRGGMGIRYIFLNEIGVEVRINNEQPGQIGASSNQMELKAVIEGLKQIEDHDITLSYNLIQVFTDSRYVSDHKDLALYNWSQNDWIKSDGRPAENAFLWKELIKVLKKINCRVEIKWVKGHAKDDDNKAVDRMARNSARSTIVGINRPMMPNKLRRKLSPEKTKVGSIEMKGQWVKIYVIEESFMSIQGLSKYRYEIVSPTSKYYKKVDLIYSDIHSLKAGHFYLVTFNNDTKNPRIKNCVRELTEDEIKVVKDKIRA